MRIIITNNKLNPRKVIKRLQIDNLIRIMNSEKGNRKL